MMDYEKKYNEALERAKELLLGNEHSNTIRSYFEHVFPELRESEDERIRKELIEFIKWSVDRHFMREDFHQAKRPSEWIAYLEKQKEFSEHGYGLYYYHNGGFTFVGRPAEEEKQKEQSLRYFIDDFPYSDEQKEQKPAEKQDYSGLNDLERAIHRGFLSAGVENVSITIIKETARECLAQMNPAEWSEEDETIIEGACNALEIYGHTKLASMLKSLRSHTYWKPSEQEKVALRTAIRILTDERNFPKAAAQLQNILDAFEGKESRKDWKPSDKQMNCLCAAVDAAIRKHNESVSGYEPARVLKSLYEDLKKL